MKKVIEKMNVVLDEGAKLPSRAHEPDAGYDLYARRTEVVAAHKSIVFDTGVHMEIPMGYAGFVKSKSGLYIRGGITSEGVVDSGYTGSIRVKLHNHSDIDYKITKGDKIAQIVILPIVTPKLVVVDALEATDRADNGFGSTGR